VSHCAAIREWYEEVWNKRDLSAITRMMAPDVVVHGLAQGGGALHGPDGFLQFHRAFTSAFPDLRLHVEDAIEQGDRVAMRFTATGTHSGDGLGFPATNRPMRVSGMTIARVVDGKFVEGWNVFDALGMMQQLGVAPQGDAW